MFHPVLSSQGHPFPIHVELEDSGLETTSQASFKITYFILYTCLLMHVWVHAHVGVYAYLCVCMHICFPMCVAARGQLQKPSLAHCPLLETGSLRRRAHRVCKAGCLASKCPSIPSSAALWYEGTYHTQLFHVASGVQPQVLILTSQNLADRAITPACHSLLYISIFNKAPF